MTVQYGASPYLFRARVQSTMRSAFARPLVVINGSPGAGKSVAVAQFLGSLDAPARHVHIVLPSTVVSSFGFVHLLASALASQVDTSELRTKLAPELALGQRDAAMALRVWMRAHLDEQPITIVIDGDLSSAPMAPLREVLIALADEPEANVTWCFVTRDGASLPTASWLAHGQMSLPIDDEVLRFTDDDVAALAQSRSSRLTESTLSLLTQKLRGWPLGTSWAIDVFDSPSAVRALSSAHDEAMAALIAQTYDRYAIKTQALDTLMMLPDLDYATIAALEAPEVAEMARLLSNEVPSLLSTSADHVRVHPDVRAAFGQHRRARGPGQLAISRSVASALEATERIPEAINVLAEAEDDDALIEALGRGANLLIDRGAWQAIDDAIQRLAKTRHAEHATLHLLRAASESQRHHLDTAEAYFRLALEGSTDPSIMTGVVQQFALEAMRRGRPDLVESLAGSVDFEDERVPLDHRLAITATRATALASRDRFTEASDLMRGVLAAMTDTIAPRTRARLFQQAAFVALRAQAFDDARSLGEAAFTTAVQAGSYSVASLAKSILYEIAIDIDDDVDAALGHAMGLEYYATLGGNARLRVFGLVGRFSIEVERGNEAALPDIERDLRSRSVTQHTVALNEALLRDEGLRAAWSGDFGRAVGMVSGTLEQETGRRRPVRAAEIAVLAAAAGETDVFHASVTLAADTWEALPLHTRSGRVPALLLIALLVSGDWAAVDALREQAMVRRAEMSARSRALLDAASALDDYLGDVVEAPAFVAALTALRRAGLGGYADLICRLVIPPKALNSTNTER